MNFELEPAHLGWQRRVREFCEREVAVRARENDEKGVFPWDLVPGLRRLGLLGIIFPKEYGGLGLDTASLCLALEELGRADAAVALTVESHNGLCTNHLFLHGSEAQRRRYLPRLCGGEALGAWALTEPAAGSDAASLKTRAVFDGKSWTLNGSKTFTTQGSVAGVYVIFAQTSAKDNGSGKDGLTAFVFEKGHPGLQVGKIEHKMGIRCSDTAQLHLVDCKASPEQVVGTPGRGFRDAMKVLDAGRVAISGISVGIARAAVEEGIKWVKPRKADYGILPGQAGLTAAGRTLAQLASEVDAARLLTLRAAWLMDSGRPFSREASMAKLISGDLAMRAPTEILDVIGPAGASLDHPVQRFFRDAKLYQIGEGSSQIQQLVISRQLLAEDVPAAEPSAAAR
ncbi:MAG: acyl-CoA dehydrogenase family protein [Elusimicrobia bacterium]|nr:acyl-CoA dehydrogenase family protein [Elusimicrobiota bacterium]MDE2426075.1 acyl-CoA dehydrogenase family protein [Elusimicrobiota bacterium]